MIAQSIRSCKYSAPNALVSSMLVRKPPDRLERH